ncbi:leucine-rich repeat domain-containing protein [uncultured Microscilla sp.]|uniref:leucine-rich repeat domain-containing protein n=1 Tax=uncultured Microscilla sp. TaxID=432653 RepID=UPI00260CC3D8|nr:leucine-rich repeat domain-containing protein [uncultured Microscilla sp.]
MSKIAQQLIDINLLTKAPELDLGYCGLDGTEDELFAQLAEADHLKTLILSDDYSMYDESSGKFLVVHNNHKGMSTRIKQIPNQLPPSLQSLFLGKFMIEDADDVLEPKNIQTIAQLKHLQILHLYGYILNDLSFLHGLPQLFELNISSSLVDTSFFTSDFAQIEFLIARDCGLTDTNLTFLTLFKNLRHLDLSCNHIQGFESFLHLYQLTSLHLASNRFAHLHLFQCLPQLEKLYIADNDIEELNGIEHLTRLRGLDLDGNLLDDLSPIKHFYHLELLSVNDNLIDDLSPIAHLTKLQYLNLGQNEYLEITALKNLKSLQVLGLYSGALDTEDILFLKDFKQLKRLNLGDNDITDLDMFKHMPQLKMLNLSDNEIENIDDLWGLTNLQWLNISDNQVTNIDCLNMLDNLRFLMMSNNHIENIDSLKYLLKLKVLDIGENHIEDISPLLNLPELGVIRLNPKSVPYLPIAIVLAFCRGEHAYDYQNEPELPAIHEIYPLMMSTDKSHQALAAQLMEKNHWTPKQIEMYQQTIEFYEEKVMKTDDNIMELYFAKEW